MSRLRLLLPLAATLWLAGCEITPDLADPVRYGPFYTPRNFAGEKRLPAEVRRVLVLPVSLGAIAPEETAAALDGVIVRALQDQQRFEVVALPRGECQRLFGAPEFSSTAALPHGMIEQIATRYAVDAVLFTDITVYQPYRPQAIGLRSKLATVRDVRLVWTFDEVISASDPAVANSARRRPVQAAQGRDPVDLSPGTLLSPTRYAAFAADEMFRTLPPR
ncbi:hypothetical protein [Oleiharenicola sp. Vm1]|uniref:hypothetical protein n=1 Tax=Oleiharenicola sp. Vm1 TaxID=3398393 RepID=UPI0039F57B85